MSTTDLTSQYLNQQIPNVVRAFGQMFDPSTRIAIDQARMNKEMFPYKLDHLQGQTSLDAARALTEGARQGLFGAQTADQQSITGFRNQLGNGIPDVQPLMPQQAAPQPAMPPPVSPQIQGATQMFNDALRVTPGAPPVAPSVDAPNPLLPALSAPSFQPQAQGGGYDPMKLAMLAAAVNKNPNPSSVVEAMAQAEALRGPMTEDRSRNLLVAQGIAPNVNTAVTPQWQGSLIDNRNGQATSMNNADNVSAMQRTIVQQEEAGKRALAGAIIKGMRGNGSDAAIKYDEQRKMGMDAGSMADNVFQINRDKAGNPSSVHGVDLPPQVVQQRDALAGRINGYLMNGHPIQHATNLAKQDLFGSINTSDPTYYTQGSGSTWGFGGHPFSAVNVNVNAMGEVDRTASEELNGPSAIARVYQSLGIGPQGSRPAQNPSFRMQGVTDGASPSLAPPASTAAEAIAPAAPVKPDPYALKPSNDAVATARSNKAKADVLRTQVQRLESLIQGGSVTVASPSYGQKVLGYTPNGHAIVRAEGNNDEYNAMVQSRAAMLKKIQELDPQSSGNGGNGSDIVRRNLKP